MEAKKVERINELARKSKTEDGLTSQELQEQKELRREYIDSFTKNLKSQLNGIEIVD